MNILNWGILSTARINRALIPPLQRSPRAHLLAVASRDLAKAQAYAAEKGIPRAYGDYAGLLADPEIDIIYNPLPNHLHAEWTIRALHAGKHVLCEKPLALSLAEMSAIEQAAAESGKLVAEAFMYRHHPQTALARQMLAEGQLGEVRLIQGAFSFNLDRPHDVRWNPAWGGGALWDVGCYPVSYARSLLGLEPEAAFAFQKLSPSGVDSVFAGLLRFPGEILLHFDCSFSSVHRTAIEVVGSQGLLRISHPFAPREKETLYFGPSHDSLQPIEVSGPTLLYLGEVEDMHDAILLGHPPRIPLSDTRANTAALLALLASARSGEMTAVQAF